MSSIPLPQPKIPDIYTFGFDNHLLRTLPEIESPLVYNSIEDRLSQLIQTSGTLTGLIPGLPEVTL